MGLNSAAVIQVLEKTFSCSFGLKEETRLYFRLETTVSGLVLQFHDLPRSEEEETASVAWQDQQAAATGFRLVHIWQDQWMRQRQIVLSRIAALLGRSEKIHGRETALKRVDVETALRFLSEHHLLVPLKGKYRFGLFYRDELVSLAVFSGGRLMKNKSPSYRSFELLRFCHAGSKLVVGGLSKLITAFTGGFHPDDIMTYVDLDWSVGQAFEKTGFKPAGRTASQLFWINPQERIRYYPRHLPGELREASPEMLHEAGYFRVYNCGSLKMLKRFSGSAFTENKETGSCDLKNADENGKDL